MGQQIYYRLQRFPCTARAAGKIEDKRFAPYAADPPAERGQRSFLCTLKTHPFGNAFQQSVTNVPGWLPG